jgi:hypothetical protein
VAPIAVNEWPAPIGFTRRPVRAEWATISCNSPTVDGVATSTSATTVPDQFRHLAMAQP